MARVKTNITQDAAVRLMLKFPFWSELYYTMTIYEDESIPTLCTDGHMLTVNPTFWRGLSLDLKIAATAHEIGHKMLLHTTRRGSRNPILWNMAGDYVINDILKQNGFTLGDGWLYDPQFTGMSTEAVYSALEKMAEKKPSGAGGSGSGGTRDRSPQQQQQGQGGTDEQEGEGEGESSDQQQADGDAGDDGSGQQDNPSDSGADGSSDGNSVTVPGVPQSWHDKWQDIVEQQGTKEEVEKVEQQFIEQVQKAILSSRAVGNAPAGMGAFDAVCEPSREPWYNHLHRFMQGLSVSEYNWAKFNRRTLVQHNIFTPHIYSEALDNVVIGIDCSGSVFNTAAQANFAGHVNAIMAETKPKKVHVIYFDSKVTRHDELDPGTLEFSTRPKGGGGTDFCPVFDFVEKHGLAPEVVIMLTDCMGGFPSEAPEYPVIWASILDEDDVRGYYPPFGEFTYVDPDA